MMLGWSEVVQWCLDRNGSICIARTSTFWLQIKSYDRNGTLVHEGKYHLHSGVEADVLAALQQRWTVL